MAGLRTAEFVRLEWSNIDLRRRFINTRSVSIAVTCPSLTIRVSDAGRYNSFGHAKTRPGGIWRDGFEELNWVAPYDRLLPLDERPAQLRQGDILQLPDPLSGHSEFLSNFFESFRFAVVQPESIKDNLLLAVVQRLQEPANFVAHVLVSEQLERRLRIFITDDLAKFG